jgi:hypothetical protein
MTNRCVFSIIHVECTYSAMEAVGLGHPGVWFVETRRKRDLHIYKMRQTLAVALTYRDQSGPPF